MNYLFGEDKTPMPSISSSNVKLAEHQIIENEDQLIKDINLIDLIKLPENINKNLYLSDDQGCWVISDMGTQLIRNHKKISSPSIESYLTVMYRKQGKISYLMTNGHTLSFLLEKDKVGVHNGSSPLILYEKYEWK